MAETFTKWPELDLYPKHPSGRTDCWRCDTCDGFFFPETAPTECPYCNEEEDDE